MSPSPITAALSTSGSRTEVPAFLQRIASASSRGSARAGGQKAGTGSGLGLSIVERTVRNHGGDVWCVSRPGGGAEFVVRLPTRDEQV